MQKNISFLLKIFALLSLLNLGIFAQRSLTDGYWALSQLNGAQIRDSKAFIAFGSDKKFTGNAGCNRMFGSFAVRGRSVKFSGIGKTKMLCGLPGVMKTEMAFTKALNDATRYSVTGDRLKIYSGRSLVLSFNKEYPTVSLADPDKPALDSVKWMLETKLPAIGDMPFIVFDEQKGSAGGNTGCNVFGGTYVTKGGAIAITEIISTMRACLEDDRMDIERNFLDGLRTADRYEIKKQKLYLFQKDKLLLTFKATDKVRE